MLDGVLQQHLAKQFEEQNEREPTEEELKEVFETFKKSDNYEAAIARIGQLIGAVVEAEEESAEEESEDESEKENMQNQKKSTKKGGVRKPSKSTGNKRKAPEATAASSRPKRVTRAAAAH